MGGERNQLAEISSGMLEHQLQQIRSDGVIEAFNVQEVEEIVNPVGVEREFAVLAVQVLEPLAEEGAEIFRATRALQTIAL